MAKNPKKKDSKTKNLENKPMHRHWPLMSAAAVAVLGLLVVGYLAFRSSTTNDTSDLDSQPVQVEASLADQLAQIEFDESVSQEDVALHYLSVASAYMADGDFDNALNQYQMAETAGAANGRLYSDVAQIYESKEDIAKRDEYLNKYIDFTLEEIAGLKDQLSISGNYIAAAQSYETLGDSGLAKSNYEKALKAVNKIESDNAEVNFMVQESKKFLEEKLAEL